VESKIVDAEATIQEIRQDFSNFDINKILEMKLQVINSERTKKEIEAEYMEMFGEAMTRE